MASPLSFAGMPVIVHRPMTVRRTWRERLFSLPWRPFRKFKTVPPAIGDGQVYRVLDTWHVTESTWDSLKKELDFLPPSRPFQDSRYNWDIRDSKNSLYNWNSPC